MEEYVVERTGFESITYSWKDLDAAIEVKQGNVFSRMKARLFSSATRKIVLQKVSGHISPGQLVAIMGPSGAGKTTLLNCLTFRNIRKFKVTGDRLINGIPVDRDLLSRVSAYVQQEDLFIETLTVSEHLEFQASLRMDRSISKENRTKRVADVMKDLRLNNCGNTVIGGAASGVKGISGGEKKRLALASEILNNPALLFCDEPTSGLDSNMALKLIQVLKELAKQGKTIICTIHQPSSEVFELFDTVILMAQGRTAFQGNLRNAADFFATQGYRCPENYNPADYYMNKLSIDPDLETESRARLNHLCDQYDRSHYAVMKGTSETNECDLDSLPKSRRYQASWWTQFRAVLWRSWISAYKKPQPVVVKLILGMVVAGFLSWLYAGQERPTKIREILSYVQNIQGALFIFLCHFTIDGIFGVITSFPLEIPIFLRDHFNNMYRADVYFLCKMITELPLFILTPLVTFVFPYCIIGFNSGVDRLFISTAVMALSANVATSFGYFISCLAADVKLAMTIIAPAVMPALLLGGFFVNSDQVPGSLDWLKYYSWFMYSNEVLNINEWQGVRFNISLCNLNMTLPLPCTGEDVLKFYSYNEDLFYIDIYCLLALLVGFRLLAFIALLWKIHQSK